VIEAGRGAVYPTDDAATHLARLAATAAAAFGCAAPGDLADSLLISCSPGSHEFIAARVTRLMERARADNAQQNEKGEFGCNCSSTNIRSSLWHNAIPRIVYLPL